MIELETPNQNYFLTYLKEVVTHAEAVIDEFRDLFFIIDEGGNILRTNPYGSSLLQSLHSKSLKDFHLSKVFSPGNWDKFSINLKRAWQLSADKDIGLDNQKLEFALTVDGLEQIKREIFWSVSPISLSGPFSHKAYWIIGRDISLSLLMEENNQQLEYQNSRITAILNSALQGFLTYDQSFKIETDYSKRAEDLLGSNLAGKNVYECLGLQASAFTEFSTVIFMGTSWDVLKNFNKMQPRPSSFRLKE